MVWLRSGYVQVRETLLGCRHTHTYPYLTLLYLTTTPYKDTFTLLKVS